jgi:hypothetical protein
MYNAGAVRAVVDSVAQDLEQRGLPAFVHSLESNGLPWGWVTPDESWPNFRKAKIGAGVVTDKTRVWTGIRWDKGLKLRARGYIVERPMVMSDEQDWDWVGLMNQLPELELAMAETQGPSPLIVQVSFSNGVVPGFRPFVSAPRHTVEWTFDHDHLVLAAPVYDIGAAQTIKNSQHLSDVFAGLAEHSDWDWTWVTLSLGWYQVAPDRPSAGTRLGRELLPRWIDPLLPFYVDLKAVQPHG